MDAGANAAAEDRIDARMASFMVSLSTKFDIIRLFLVRRQDVCFVWVERRLLRSFVQGPQPRLTDP